MEDEDEDEYEMDTNVPEEENDEYEVYPQKLVMILKVLMIYICYIAL